MKDIFLFFSDFLAKFLQQREGTGGQEEQQGGQVGGQAAQGQHRRAQGKEIGRAAGQDGQQGVKPGLPALDGDGPQQQHHGGGQPE